MKKLNFTSAQEYTTPTIEVQELEKQDVLTASGEVEVEAQDLLGPGDAPRDLLSSIFTDIS